MTVTLTDGFIGARLGVGALKRRIPLQEVRAYWRLRNPWYFGQGIRFSPGGTSYDVSGSTAADELLRVQLPLLLGRERLRRSPDRRLVGRR